MWVVLSFVTFCRSLKICRSFFAYFSTASCESIGGISGAWWQASGGVDERMQILKSGWHPLNLYPLFQYSKC